MKAARNFTVIPGSDRAPVPGARKVRSCHPDQTVQISITLRPKSEAKLAKLKTALAKPGFKPLTRAEFAKTYGASPSDLNQVKKFAKEYGLKVIETGNEFARRTVMLSGTVSNMQKAFQVELNEYSHSNGSFRGRTGTISVPTKYAGAIAGVFGLDNRPQAKPHFRLLTQPQKHKGKTPDAASPASYNPNQMAQIYDYPNADGTGQCIAIIELGGGFQVSDLTTYFQSLNINEPQVISESVDGGTNSPSTPDSADAEVLLDIEVAGAIAPGAKIVVYFAPNTDQGYLDAVTTAIHDTTNNPSVISISWGGPESSWTTQALTNFDQAFQSAAALGVTVCIAAGDNGSTDGVTDGSNNVDFPASDPFVLGCGGTTIQTSNNQIVSEVVWNDLPNGGATGGGVSNSFPLPTWQNGFNVPAATSSGGGRGVPDVAGDADPNSGYNILVDGQNEVVGGTSAVAPLWAGLVARINQQLGKSIGFLNPTIYAQAVEAAGFHDITQGNNGAFSAAAGWDPCTGLGSPDGARLLAALTPASATNAARRSKNQAA